MASLSVILYGPEQPGNVGAVARVMKNFGLKDLVLISPACDHLCSDARNRAKHAQDVLEKAVVGKSSLLDKFDLVVATSGKLGSDYNVPRIPLTPEQLRGTLSSKKGRIALLFGRESHGLTNDEMKKADILVTIPTNEKYPVLNLSHAVGILLYELTKGANDRSERYPLANRRQKEELSKLLESRLGEMRFSTDDKRETQRRVWKRVFALLTAREAQALLGFFKKLPKR